MGQSLITIRIDEKLKENFDYVCNELGMSMSTAITIYAKQVCREGAIPFKITMGDDYKKNEVSIMPEKIMYKAYVCPSDKTYALEHDLLLEKNFENLDAALDFIKDEWESMFDVLIQMDAQSLFMDFAISVYNSDVPMYTIIFNDEGLRYEDQKTSRLLDYDREKHEEDDDYIFDFIKGFINGLMV